jgi:16S rRNA (guanine527-N7)-methyltransferase
VQSTQSKHHFRIRRWFPKLSDHEIASMEVYFRELLKFNMKINLVSPRTLDEADILHFADSILGCQIVLEDESISEIHDFGSGNGFPGLIMGILRPDLKLTLMESDKRKAEFIKHVASVLHLKNLNVRSERVESLKPGTVTTAICRAFANLPRSLLLTRKVFEVGGSFYHFKGNEWSFEMAQLPEQLCSTWNTKLVKEYELPETDISHSILVSTKLK